MQPILDTSAVIQQAEEASLMENIRRQGAGKSIRVAIPRSLAFDLDAFTKVQKGILDRMGCGACCSDIDIRWDVINAEAAPDFRVSESGEILNQ
jgi:hypothetical protein